MTTIYENELYELQEMPKDYDNEKCRKCGSDDYGRDAPDEAELLEGWEIRTCWGCGSKWELSLYKNGIYFYGEDGAEVLFN
ncbi:hypothetical protein E2R68_00690 [Psychromonas sp. RZ22]|uniref:hypothetical protein n=1 Tax=Psychromonas algarum TaxID=2555643 RepID=UPI001067D930|nr:hypothetical protein [Psychromonas sp. RZ22]TEW56586.1 hypothetical protein E2R68_00690 [Psychromonas sp. RZ22]